MRQKLNLQHLWKMKYPSLDKFLSVVCAGIFLVPPLNTREQFPGACIFLSNDELMPSMEPKSRRVGRGGWP